MGKDPEGNVHILYFLSNSVSPKGIAILAVKFIYLLNSLRHINAKFMGMFDVVGLLFANKGNDPLMVPEDIIHPPIECRLMVNANGLCIFCGLDRV